jgi:hypothetical protein
VPVLCCLSDVSLLTPSMDVPKFGRGSSSWAGSENRTEARSDTPMNLRTRQRRVCWSRVQAAAYFLNTPSSIFNLELSSGAFSAGAPDGIVAPDVFLEWWSDDLVEPGRVFSAGGSAMMSVFRLPGSTSAGRCRNEPWQCASPNYSAWRVRTVESLTSVPISLIGPQRGNRSKKEQYFVMLEKHSVERRLEQSICMELAYDI